MPPEFFGWAGPEAARRAYDQFGDSFIPFRIIGAAGQPTASRVNLYDAPKTVTGQFVPNIKQLIGDCVSWGARNAVDILECVEIALRGEREEYRPSFAPYFYGISRVQIGGQRGDYSDGSTGTWAAKGVQQYGVLPAKSEGVPEYSAKLAKEWGANGPPQKFIDLAKPHLVQSAARVTSFAEAADAIINGYPVTVASDQGFAMEGRERGGKLFGIPQGQWMHQMAFTAADKDPQYPALFCQNSWGPDLWPNQPDGAPPGGFWVDDRTATRMLSQGDSYAFSQFQGFPAQAINWQQF
jgi:hypothetical protein